MKRIIVIILVFSFSCKGAFSQINPNLIFEKNISVIQDFVKEKETEGYSLQNAVNFLEDLTDIKSNIAEGYDDLIAPNKKNLKDWKAWYKKNKDLLYWDEKEQKVKVKK